LIVKRGLYSLSFIIRAVCNRELLTFFSLAYQMSRTRLHPVFPRLGFVDQTLFSHYLSSLRYHVHIRHGRDYNDKRQL